MDKLLHALAVLVAALSHVHLAASHALPHDRQLDAGLATYGGVTAWWGSTGEGPEVAHLMVRTRQGKVMALPPTLSEEAETVDVGRGPEGPVWITYARCHGSSASCQAYAYNMRTRREQPLPLGQAVAVAVDGTKVAWVREPRRYGPSQLLVGSLPAPGASARRITLAPIDFEPVGDFDSLDLRDGRLAYVAWEAGGDGRVETLRAGPLDAIGPIAHGSDGEECTYHLGSPTLTAGALTWLQATYGPRSSCQPRRDTLVRRTGATEQHLPVAVRAAKEAVVLDGGRLFTLAPRHPDGDQGDRGACNPDPLFHDEGAGFAGCAARVVRAPRWLPGRGS